MEKNWRFPEIDHDYSHRCPNYRFYKGRSLCIIFKRDCSGWKLTCAMRGITVDKKLYDLWKEKGYI